MAIRLPDAEEETGGGPDRGAQVWEWRVEQFERLGFGEWSQTLANLPVELSEARRLIDGGCPPATAVRILLP